MILRLDNFKKYLFENKINKHLSNVNLFTINENVEVTIERDEVINKLLHVDLTTTPQEFIKSINKSKHKEMLSDYTISELSSMRLYKVPGYNIGYALKDTPDGTDIVSVHNNEPTIKNMGEYIIKSAIQNGGNMLDHFDVEPLNTIYSNMGFIEYNRDSYNPEYDENGSFANKYGKLDVIYRKLK